MLFLTALAGLALAAEPETEIVSKPDVTYLERDGDKLQLDLVLPKSKGPHPIVICFHGGAWMAGGRKDLTTPALFNPGGSDGKKTFAVLENLAKNGYAAATVSYRLAPKHKFPAQIEDAKAAVKFLRSEAKAYDLDPDRIGAMGFSAGGHLALMLGLTTPEAGFEGTALPKVSSSVQCVVDYFGPTDMTLYKDNEAAMKSGMKPFLGKECLTDDAVLKKASPVSYVHKKAAPTLIIHGTMDLIVPYVHSESLHKTLVKEGAKAELVPIRWKGHGWEEPAAVEKAAKATLKFLDEQLKAAGDKK